MADHATRSTLAFTARVYGIMDGAVYLSGRTGPDDESAVSVMVPLAVLGRRPELGEEMPVTVRIGAATPREVGHG